MLGYSNDQLNNRIDHLHVTIGEATSDWFKYLGGK